MVSIFAMPRFSAHVHLHILRCTPIVRWHEGDLDRHARLREF